ncbi:MAG: hypothetical protein ABFD50_06490 [Smithella sp.]
MPRIINHIYECDVCGKREPWNDNWRWYGSQLDLEAGCVPTICSNECRTKFDHKIRKQKAMTSTKRPDITKE